jgi:hypothetical protein
MQSVKYFLTNYMFYIDKINPSIKLFNDAVKTVLRAILRSLRAVLEFSMRIDICRGWNSHGYDN